MKRALILKNIDREGPGKISSILEKYAYTLEVELASDTSDYKNYVDKYDLLVVLGGPDSANDGTKKIKKELAFIKEWLEADKPYFGICLGLQLMVKSLGGKVVANEVEEVGFYHGLNDFNTYKVTIDSLELLEPFSKWYLDEIPVFQLHGETVVFKKLEGLKSIGCSSYCRNQIIIRKDNQIAFQFHIEATSELYSNWYKSDPMLELKDWEKDMHLFMKIEKDLTKRSDTVIKEALISQSD